jgi:chromosome partitioning protein
MGHATTLAVASEKGGVGKTTVVLNLGLALARRGWRTLVVDTDPQGAISLSLDRDARASAGLAELADGTATFEEVRVETKVPELSFVPIGAVHRDSERLGRALDRVLELASDSYDLILFDTASGLGGHTSAVLKRTAQVLVPVQAEPLSLRTLKGTLDRLAELREECGLQLLGVVLTMVQSSDPVSLASVQEVWSVLPARIVFDGFLPRDPAFLKASAYGVPVQMLSRRRPPAVAAVFESLAGEVEDRLGLDTAKEDDVVPLLA